MGIHPPTPPNTTTTTSTLPPTHRTDGRCFSRIEKDDITSTPDASINLPTMNDAVGGGKLKGLRSCAGADNSLRADLVLQRNVSTSAPSRQKNAVIKFLPSASGTRRSGGRRRPRSPHSHSRVTLRASVSPSDLRGGKSEGAAGFGGRAVAGGPTAAWTVRRRAAVGDQVVLTVIHYCHHVLYENKRGAHRRRWIPASLNGCKLLLRYM